MYQKQLRQAGHTRRYEINEHAGAWDVRALLDTEVLEQVRYEDWHRVERAMLRFDLEVLSLQDEGWEAD